MCFDFILANYLQAKYLAVVQNVRPLYLRGLLNNYK